MLCAGWWISSDSAEGTCLYSESKHNETKFDGTTLVIFFSDSKLYATNGYNCLAFSTNYAQSWA